ncbi:dentin sialophosphoprotein-like [Quillaja saponaria]|uniref:Dentin sialophosphoprotein-like n=1 Tax=Quillaja saponaria TaxID=32244 RepID=A0AAD7PU83_QUISA|nr:dentin sialophosphoprotein-like [Quillaja saponaria]
MIKRLPSRNNRSKGVKLKHVLQICLLLGVCFWLIYQVKHSHDKKKEYEEKDAKTSVRTQSDDHILKFGRKDLPRVDEVTNKNEEEEEDETVGEVEENKHGEREEDNKNEAEEQEEENHHDVEEQEEEEKKSEETEDGGRGGGDDEIDEKEQEKSEAEADRDEEFIGEEKEKEEGGEKETENSEDGEKEGSVENQNAHEAREEHYKGDDASSAVAHDTNTVNTETEKVSSENSNNLEQMHKPNGTEETNRNENDMEFKVTEGERTKTGPSLNATAGEEIGNSSLSTLDGSHPNTTIMTNNADHLETSSNMTVLTAEASINTTGFSADIYTSSQAQHNGIEILSESTHNATVNGTIAGDVKNVLNNNTVSKEGVSESNLTASIGTENGDTAEGQSSNSQNGEPEKIIRFEETNGAENNSILSHTSNNTDAAEDEKSKGNTEQGETEQSSESSANGDSDAVQHNPIDFSDSHNHQDEAKARIDLGTLPDIKTEVDNNEETEAE